jgi:sensor histidine kinase YesM
MGFVPFVVVISGVLFLTIAVSYHTFKNYRTAILDLISRIQDLKNQVRADVDQLETLSVPELEGFCENLCGYLAGRLDNQTLESKMASINVAFGELYSEIESKHIQDELLKSINKNVLSIASLNKALKENQHAYEKLLAEKPYSFVGQMLHFQPVPFPAENFVQRSSAA